MDEKRYFELFGKALYHIDAIYAEFAKESGIPPTLIWILYALNDGRTHTQKDICYDWSLPKSTVNTLIMDLKRKGYVDLIKVKGMRRDMEIVLTKKGQDFADIVLTDIYKKENEVFTKLDFNTEVFIDNLLKMEKYLEE